MRRSSWRGNSWPRSSRRCSLTLPADGSSVQRSSVGRALVRPEQVGREHLRVAHDVEHDPPVGAVVGVHRVEHVAGLDFGPATSLTRSPRAAAGPRARRSRGSRRTGTPPCSSATFDVEHAGQVEQHEVLLGDGAVVRHRLPGTGHVHGLAHAAVGADDDVLDQIPTPSSTTTACSSPVSGSRFGCAVNSPAACRRSRSARRSRARRRARRAGRPPRRSRRCVRRGRSRWCWRRRRPCRGAGRAPAASPSRRRRRRRARSGCGTTRPAVAQADAVHHAVAGEPVVLRGVRRGDRIRADAQQAAVKFARDLSGDAQACRR